LNGSDSEQEGDKKQVRKRKEKTPAERQRERERKDKQNQESLNKLISFTEVTSGNRNNQNDKNNEGQVHLLTSPGKTSNGDINFDEATIKKYES